VNERGIVVGYRKCATSAVEFEIIIQNNKWNHRTITSSFPHATPYIFLRYFSSLSGTGGPSSSFSTWLGATESFLSCRGSYVVLGKNNLGSYLVAGKISTDVDGAFFVDVWVGRLYMNTWSIASSMSSRILLELDDVAETDFVSKADSGKEKVKDIGRSCRV
jgi:hypothetical protein